MCEMTHLHSTDGVFNSRRGHLRINTKSIKTLGGWGTPLWELTPLTRPSPKRHPSSQHFGLPATALGTEAAEGLQVTVEPEPSYATVHPQLFTAFARSVCMRCRRYVHEAASGLSRALQYLSSVAVRRTMTYRPMHVECRPSSCLPCNENKDADNGTYILVDLLSCMECSVCLPVP